MQYGRMHIIIILCDASMTTKLKKRVVVLGVGVWVCHGKCITVIHFLAQVTCTACDCRFYWLSKTSLCLNLQLCFLGWTLRAVVYIPRASTWDENKNKNKEVVLVLSVGRKHDSIIEDWRTVPEMLQYICLVLSQLIKRVWEETWSKGWVGCSNNLDGIVVLERDQPEQPSFRGGVFWGGVFRGRVFLGNSAIYVVKCYPCGEMVNIWWVNFYVVRRAYVVNRALRNFTTK